MLQNPRDKAALPRRSPKPGGNFQGLCECESVLEDFFAPKPYILKMGLGAPARSALECGVQRRSVACENLNRSQPRETPGVPLRGNLGEKYHDNRGVLDEPYHDC